MGNIGFARKKHLPVSTTHLYENSRVSARYVSEFPTNGRCEQARSIPVERDIIRTNDVIAADQAILRRQHEHINAFGRLSSEVRSENSKRWTIVQVHRTSPAATSLFSARATEYDRAIAHREGPRRVSCFNR